MKKCKHINPSPCSPNDEHYRDINRQNGWIRKNLRVDISASESAPSDEQREGRLPCGVKCFTQSSGFVMSACYNKHTLVQMTL